MKEYEATTKFSLLRRTPTIIRVDGKTFHTWTRNLNKEVDPSLETGPFSQTLHNAMVNAIIFAMENMQNVQIAYTQSDEISFLLRDWDAHETQQWFGGGIQKIASVTASLITGYFNQFFANLQLGLPPAFFDARVFQLPKEDIVNMFYWRQQDASRNSINMLGRYYFSHKQLYKKTTGEVQDMLMEQHNVNWNDLDTWKKRGSCVIRQQIQIPTKIGIETNQKLTTEFTERTILHEDDQIPIFSKDRNYIGKFLDATPPTNQHSQRTSLD